MGEEGRGRTKVDARKHTGVGSGSVGVQDLDGDELDVLGDPIVLAADCPCDVAAVPILVGVL